MAVNLASALDADEIVTGLSRFIKQKDIALGAGVSERTVHSWAKHKVPVRPGNYRNLAAVRDTVVVLSDSLTERGVRQWLLAPNRMLDRKAPIQVLREGDSDKVLAAAKAFIEGVYL